MIVLLVAVAIAPSVAIIWYFYSQDEFEKEPTHLLVKAFLFGIVGVIPALIGGFIGTSIGLDISPNPFFTLIYTFIVIGFSEEFGKFIFLKWFVFKQEAFNEPYDGILYAVMIGMGFATFENIIYVVEGGLKIGVLRMFTAVPAHAAFGVIMGYYVGLAKFQEKKPGSNEGLLWQGLLWAVIAHGAYDFFLMQQNMEALVTVAIFVLFLSLQFSARAVKLHQAASPFHPSNVKISQSAPKNALGLTTMSNNEQENVKDNSLNIHPSIAPNEEMQTLKRELFPHTLGKSITNVEETEWNNVKDWLDIEEKETKEKEIRG